MKGGRLTLKELDLTRLISAIEIDPRLDLPLHIVVEERGNAVMIIQICQSTYSSRTDFTKKLKYEGRDIFVYDFSEKKDPDKVIFFNQDTPTWRLAIYRYMQVIRLFDMKEIDSFP